MNSKNECYLVSDTGELLGSK